MSELGSNELSTNALEETVVQLKDNIKTLQEVVKDAESRAKESEEKFAELTIELATAEKQKEAAVTSVTSLQNKVESEKKSSNTQIQAKVYEIEELEKDSKTKLEKLKKEGEESVVALELKIVGLKRELKEAQEKCIKSKKFCDELLQKVADFEKKVKTETETRINAEIVSASTIAKLESDKAKELADLSASQEKELQQKVFDFEKEIRIETEARALQEKELKESAVNLQNLQGLYNEQTKAIETLKSERGSLPKIVNLGFSVAGEQTKKSIKGVVGRGRSAARGVSLKGGALVREARSRSRGLTRGMRSLSRQRIITECEVEKNVLSTKPKLGSVLIPVNASVEVEISKKKKLSACITKNCSKPATTGIHETAASPKPASVSAE